MFISFRMYYFIVLKTDMKKYLIICTLLSLLLSCAPGLYKSTNKSYKKQIKGYSKLLNEYPLKDSAGVQFAPDWVGTTNFSLRKPNFVVIHHTAQNSCDQTLKTFTLPRTQVSAHYVICREGFVYHMLHDNLRAHHAGLGKWGNVSDMNSSSIGIEIDNNGSEPFTDTQMNSLIQLLDRLKKAYNIPQANFIGHMDWAPGRKVDPSREFSWKQLADKGFGYWYDTTAVNVPADFNAVQALRIIGYNINNPSIAIQSYKIHWVPQDTTKVINEMDKKILVDLTKKYQ